MSMANHDGTGEKQAKKRAAAVGGPWGSPAAGEEGYGRYIIGTIVPLVTLTRSPPRHDG